MVRLASITWVKLARGIAPLAWAAECCPGRPNRSTPEENSIPKGHNHEADPDIDPRRPWGLTGAPRRGLRLEWRQLEQFCRERDDEQRLQYRGMSERCLLLDHDLAGRAHVGGRSVKSDPTKNGLQTASDEAKAATEALASDLSGLESPTRRPAKLPRTQSISSRRACRSRSTQSRVQSRASPV
jgi:hypothetical protein